MVEDCRLELEGTRAVRAVTRSGYFPTTVTKFHPDTRMKTVGGREQFGHIREKASFFGRHRFAAAGPKLVQNLARFLYRFGLVTRDGERYVEQSVYGRQPRFLFTIGILVYRQIERETAAEKRR
jgi:hypothetical protein